MDTRDSILANVAQDMRDVRQAMVQITRDSHENALKLERLLGKLENLEKVPARMDNMDARVDDMEVRLSLVESSARQTDQDKPSILGRIKSLEDKEIRRAAVLATLVFLMELGFQLVKWWTP